MLVLIKNYMNYFKDNIFKCFLKRYIRLLFFKKSNFFSKYVMTENPRPEVEKIIKDIRNLFRLKKTKQNDTAIKDIRNLFKLKKEAKGIKDIIIRNISNLFEYGKEEEKYYKPVRVNRF